jgi:hypothetical protein
VGDDCRLEGNIGSVVGEGASYFGGDVQGRHSATIPHALTSKGWLQTPHETSPSGFAPTGHRRECW